MKKKVLPALPKGFTAIRGGGDFAERWDFDRQPELLGVLKNVRKVDLPKKGRIPARKGVPVYVIATDGGDVSVWESAGLRALATVKKGRTVYVRYLGKKKIKGQSNPMRDFMVGVK